MVTKFLITIIIALSIEGLMVVFKIAIENYTHMINALYLITGISMPNSFEARYKAMLKFIS